MPAPYSYDLRTKVIEAIDGGMGKTQASKGACHFLGIKIRLEEINTHRAAL
jgi:hypothetical protein